jgi:hypothetical protein
MKMQNSGRNITNRWSSRLGGSWGPRVLTRREPRFLCVVGGAAQLYVRFLDLLFILVLTNEVLCNRFVVS